MRILAAALLTAALVTSAQAAPKLPAKKKSAAVALPAYKGKKKVAVDLQVTQTTEVGVVLVAEPTALDKAQAKELKQETKVVAKPTPAAAIDVPATSTVAEATPAPKAPADTPVSETPTSKIEDQTQAPTKDVVEDVKKMETYELSPAPAQAMSNAVPAAFEKPETIAAATIATTATTSATTTSITSLAAPEARQRISGHRSVFFDTGLLNSRYDKLQSDLKNGASTMSITVGIEVENFEVRAALDVAHGLDQAVTPQNTRMLAARGGVAKNVGRLGRIDISAGGTIGAAGLDVRSYRGVSTNGFTLKQHAMGTAMVIAPELEARVALGSQALARLALRYWHFAGPDDLTKLSALSGTVGLGYAF